MKHKLTFKFLFGYLLFAVLGFLLVGTFSSYLTYRHLLKQHVDHLYEEANTLASDYRFQYQANGGSADISDRAAVVADCFDCDVWVITKSGEILYDSSFDHTRQTVDDFDPTDKGSQVYSVSTFYDVYEEEMLSVAAPIPGNFSVYGYVILHYPMELLLDGRDASLNIVYMTAGLLLLLSGLFLFLYLQYIHRPLRLITDAAKEYAAGNLHHRIELASADEIGDLADTLNYMASELSDMEETQRKFVSNISHDFRSPLTSIKGYLEAMIDGTIPPELYNKYMSLVIAETERLTKLTSSTLALRSLEAGGTLLDQETFDINAVIKNTAAAFEGPCRQKKLMLDLTFSDDATYVWADMSKIQQVLYNLLDNAIKFSNPGTVIWIEVYSRNETIFISIKDSGVGIPRDSLKKIWSRFYKADNSRGKDKKGTGLGLAICREIINAHGQTIDVISTEGVGSEFIFTLKKSDRNDGKESLFF